MENEYFCSGCNKVIKMDSNKKWITSYCGSAGRPVRITIVEKIDITKLTSKYLPNLFDLKSFKKKDVELLKLAFWQGATVMRNELKNRKIKP